MTTNALRLLLLSGFVMLCVGIADLTLARHIQAVRTENALMQELGR